MVIAAKGALCVAKLVTKVAMFLREHGSVELATLFGHDRFQLKVFDFPDTFSLLNELSYSLQGKNLQRSPPSKRSYPYEKRE